jgi:prepilin peptidase CpaA
VRPLAAGGVFRDRSWMVSIVLWLPFLLLVVATVVDLRRREVPDSVSMALLGWAITATAVGWSPNGWPSLLFGLACGLAIGIVLFALGAFGGGDAKLIAALGAVLGPQAFLMFLFYVAIAGGVFALVAAARGKSELAYAPAITLGFLTVIVTRGAW